MEKAHPKCISKPFISMAIFEKIWRSVPVSYWSTWLLASYIWGQKPSWVIRKRTRYRKFFKNRNRYKQLGNTFGVCFFHFWYYKSDILDLNAKFWLYIKKCQIHVFEQIWQVSQILLKNSSTSSNMPKPSLEPCRIDLGDDFQKLSWCHIKSRLDFGCVEKKVSFLLFYAIFLKEYFKVLFKQLVFDTFEFFSSFVWD